MADKAEQFRQANAQKKEAQSRETADGGKEYLDEATGEWVSKNELKKRETLRNKALKEKAKKETAPAAQKKAEKTSAEDEDELDPTKYRENRMQMLEQMREKGANPYPHKFNRDMTVQQFREKYEEK